MGGTEVYGEFAAASLVPKKDVPRIVGEHGLEYGDADQKKQQSFLIVTTLYTTFIPPLLLALIIRPLSWGYINYLPAGPTALIFALLAQYHAAVPYEYKYRISASGSASATSSTTTSPSSSFSLTSKSTTYLLPAQLALSQLPGSAIVALVGWVVGYAYRMDLLPGGALSWRVPVKRLGRKERERVEGLRRRMEGESAAASASGVESGGGGGRGGGDGAGAGRRGFGGQILEQFRGGN